MKRIVFVVSFGIALCMVFLGAVFFGVSFAEDSAADASAVNTATQAAAIAKGTELSQSEQAAEPQSAELAAMSLSIDDAFKALEDSPQREIIDIQYTADRAVARGYAEGASNIKEAKDTIDALYSSGDPVKQAQASAMEASMDFSNERAVKASRDFANLVLEPNKTARLNALRTSLHKTYYSVKNLEEMCSIAEESMELSQKILDQTKLKYSLGTVSKIELLNAETELATAKDNYEAAKNGLSQAKMGFNIYMGFDLLQEVNLTSEITEATLPAITLEEAIASGIENRLEIKSAEHNMNMAKISAGVYTAYPSNSSKYLQGKATILGAQAALDAAVPSVEMDIRTRHMDMLQKHAELQTAKRSVETSREMHRLAGLQYESGFCTLTVLQQAKLGYIVAQNTLAAALLDYNLAVENFIYSYGCGTEAVKL